MKKDKCGELKPENWVCARCDDKNEKENEIIEKGMIVSHGICKSCLKKKL